MENKTGRTFHDLLIEKPKWFIIGVIVLLFIFFVAWYNGYRLSSKQTIFGLSFEKDTTQSFPEIQQEVISTIDSASHADRFFKMANNVNDYYRKIELYDSAILFYPTAQYYYFRGKTKIKNNDFKSAIEDLNQSILLDSFNPYVYDHLGLAKLNICRYSSTKELCWEAIRDFNKAISLFEERKNENYKVSSAYYNQGLAYEEVKEYCIALDKCKLANKSRRHRVYEEEIKKLKSLCK